MPALFAPAALLQLAAPDTVVATVARDGLQTAALVAILVLGVFTLVLLLAVPVLLYLVLKLNRTVKRLGEKAADRAQPILAEGKSVAENVTFITDAVRTDVERLNGTVKALTARLHQASERMEDRIEEFNALMEVVQSEAEDIFIGTASTMRGVKEGARTLRRGDGDGRRPEGPPEPLSPPGPSQEGERTEPRDQDLLPGGAVSGPTAPEVDE